MRTRTISVAFAAVFVCVAVYVATVFATPASGFSGTTIAVGRFGDIDVINHAFAAGLRSPHTRRVWFSLQKTKGPADLYVQDNVWTPGGSTGWHTHPGHSLIIVTAGTVSVYEGNDPSCTPQIYTEGMGFVDPGGDHIHLIRNEGTVDARTIAAQLIPAGATRRIDAEAPSACANLF